MVCPLSVLEEMLLLLVPGPDLHSKKHFFNAFNYSLYYTTILDKSVGEVASL